MLEDKKPNYLIVGASGFIGEELCKTFSESGVEAQALFRYTRPQPRPMISPVCCNLFQEQALRNILTGVDVVIHLAWQGGLSGPKQNGEVDDELFANLKMTKTLIRVAEESQVERIVFVSAVGARKDAPSRFLREKYRCEMEILNSDIPEKVIIRPGIVYDGKITSDRFLQTITNLMVYPWFYPLPKADQRVSTVYLGDLVKVCLDAARTEMTSANAILEVCESHSYTLESICRLASLRFVQGKRIPIKGAAAKYFLDFVEKRQRGTEVESILNYLAFNQTQDSDLQVENPLKDVLPAQMHSFAEIINQNPVT